MTSIGPQFILALTLRISLLHFLYKWQWRSSFKPSFLVAIPTPNSHIKGWIPFLRFSSTFFCSCWWIPVCEWSHNACCIAFCWSSLCSLHYSHSYHIIQPLQGSLCTGQLSWCQHFDTQYKSRYSSFPIFRWFQVLHVCKFFPNYNFNLYIY